jgi:hypothetical protein
VTDGTGFITFFCQDGDYWLYINGQSFELIIDLDPNLTHVWPASTSWPQTVPAAVWVINHGLNTFPDVSIKDPLNQEMFGQVDHIDDQNLTITFGSPVTGTAYLRR